MGFFGVSWRLHCIFYSLCGAILLLVLYQSQLVFKASVTTRASIENEETGLPIVVNPHGSHNHGPDIHKEDPVFGHTGDLDHEHEEEKNRNDNRISIAVGCAITTRNLILNQSDVLIPRIQILRSFIPSFCKTSSPGFIYHFYLSYDIDDPFFQEKDSHRKFEEKAYEIIKKVCKEGVNITIHYIECAHHGHPAWAQNDAMWEAYLDNRDYYFRINDDTIMLSENWANSFVNALQEAHPQNVGVVGPMHRGGNEDILTYDFVHKTHLDIFGYYYPRTFTDWFADDWITRVYSPDFALKLPNARLIHTGQGGTRYEPDDSVRKRLKAQVEFDKNVLERYVKVKDVVHANAPDGTKIIAMTLYGSDPKYTFGAIRNAQLVSIIFPGWKIRMYMEKPYNGKFRYGKVPLRIVKKLKDLKAEIVLIDVQKELVAPMMWRFLVGDDMDVEYFLVRDVDSRLNERDAAVVKEWMKTGSPFHCIRDHPSHTASALSGGMIGGKPKEVKEILHGIRWADLMRNIHDGYMQDMHFLNHMMWPRIQNQAYCHDSVSCDKYLNSFQFPLARKGTEHVGQVFDAFGLPRQMDMDILDETDPKPECGDIRNKAKNANDVFRFLRPPQDKIPGTNTNQSLLIMQNHGSSIIPVSKKIVIWTMDYHISPVLDVKSILKPAGVKFIDKSLSRKCTMTDTCPTDLRIVDGAIAKDASTDLIERFYKEYVNDIEMTSVSHFLCFKPVSICEFYMKFVNKSIIVIATSRYEEGRYTEERWNDWNKKLIEIAQNPKNVVAANNKYDVEYIRYFTGIDPEYVPNYCGYVETSYSPRKKEYLLAPMTNKTFQDYFLKKLNEAISNKNADVTVKPLRELYPEYKFSQLAAHQGIIYVPHQVSMISMCEQYRMNIPLYFPSLDLLISWHKEFGIMSDRTYNHMRKLMGFVKNCSPIKGHFKLPDPNDENDPMSSRYWLRFADFYQWPHIIHYESIDNLVDHILHTNPMGVSQNMKEFNVKFQKEVSQKWADILKKSIAS